METKRWTTMILLVMAGLAVACGPVSLQPLYTDKSLIVEPALVGTWRGDDATWKFTLGKDLSYDLLVVEGETTSPFTAHLVQLGPYHFLDLLPAKPHMLSDFYTDHLIAAHTFYKITGEGNRLQLAALNEDWLKERIEQKGIAIDHQFATGGKLVLTASTADLQEFVSRYADDPKAFSKDPSGDWVLELVKVQSPVASR